MLANTFYDTMISLRWFVVTGSCFAFKYAYNLDAALVPPDHLSNGTDQEQAQYAFNGVVAAHEGSLWNNQGTTQPKHRRH